MTTNIKFAKVRPDAIIPTKRIEDAGWDIYANFEPDWIEIPPHDNKLIPTGIASAISSDYAIVLRERGSTGVKNLKISAGVIDSGFRNEWFVCLYNGNDVPVFISKIGDTGEQSPLTEHPDAILYPYTKAIAQALIIPVPMVNVEEISYEELLNIPSERGLGQIGSSQK
jgi:dUTP pyrophosphatase